MNTPQTFKQVDVKRAIKAALDAGLTVGGFEIDRNGTIKVLTDTEKQIARGPEPDL